MSNMLELISGGRAFGIVGTAGSFSYLSHRTISFSFVCVCCSDCAAGTNDEEFILSFHAVFAFTTVSFTLLLPVTFLSAHDVACNCKSLVINALLYAANCSLSLFCNKVRRKILTCSQLSHQRLS